MIVIPVVVRTTEDMLTLVPNPLREAAAALGMPRSHMVIKIAYRAARTGLITGILLAIARVSGETAPLLFTVLSSPYFSTDLNKEIPSGLYVAVAQILSYIFRVRTLNPTIAARVVRPNPTVDDEYLDA